MDTEDDPERADLLKFVVAIMTKDYSKAIHMGASILVRQPNDHHVRKCLSALRKMEKSLKSSDVQETNLSDNEATISTSGTEESDEAGSSTDDSVDETADPMDTVIIEAPAVVSTAKKVCQSPSSRSIADCVREAVSASTGSTDGKLLTFREKMYRVLPLKFVRKKKN